MALRWGRSGRGRSSGGGSSGGGWVSATGSGTKVVANFGQNGRVLGLNVQGSVLKREHFD